jgi:Arc/MetJ-type ribon-helix-helix transcriptional regulator
MEWFSSMVKKEAATWNIQVPKALDKAVDKAIEENWHYTKTEFIRDAVREKLKTLGINPHETVNNSNRNPSIKHANSPKHTFPRTQTEDKNND